MFYCNCGRFFPRRWGLALLRLILILYSPKPSKSNKPFSEKMWKYSPTNLSADIVRCFPCSPTRTGFSPSLKCSETRLTDEENSILPTIIQLKEQQGAPCLGGQLLLCFNMELESPFELRREMEKRSFRKIYIEILIFLFLFV